MLPLSQLGYLSHTKIQTFAFQPIVNTSFPERQEGRSLPNLQSLGVAE